MASNGNDIDPEVDVYVRRANGFVRAVVANIGNKKIIEEILLNYHKKDELVAMQYSDENSEKLRDEEAGGEPGTSHRG